MKLYWHKWVTRRGTAYHLSTEPFNGDTATRRLTGELASIIHLGEHRWRYDIAQPPGEKIVGTWGIVGSPVRARRLVEDFFDRKSIAIWEIDDIEFIPANEAAP